jgi:hypothetical protein
MTNIDIPFIDLKCTYFISVCECEGGGGDREIKGEPHKENKK